MISAEEPLPQTLIDAVANAKRLVVISGAGVSAESGVPTFRGPHGLWKNYRPEELATPEAFQHDPALVWEWYNWRRGLIAACAPNPAHDVLVALEQEQALKEDGSFLLITQNVDNLHRKAGSEEVIEIHGNLFQLRCTRNPEHRQDHPLEENSLEPLCSICGAPGRPHVVWFGETLDSGDFLRACEALHECDAALVLGTSGVVYPVAGLPRIAHEAGAYVGMINLEPSPLEVLARDFVLGPAGVRMTELATALGLSIF